MAPGLLCLGSSYPRQLSLPGAGAKLTPPQHLARLQAFRVEHFSAVVGRPTSTRLEETRQLASVCFGPAVKRTHA